jgi:hypothetical protein
LGLSDILLVHIWIKYIGIQEGRRQRFAGAEDKNFARVEGENIVIV